MHGVQTSFGPLEYEDTGGDPPVVVLVHGLLMNTTLREEVMADLGRDHRCLAPLLPLSGHRRAITGGGDLSILAVARLLGEFLVVLNLDAVTSLGTTRAARSSSCSPQMNIAHRPDRARLCDAFDNYPPGLTGRAPVTMGMLPPRNRQAIAKLTPGAR